MDPSKKKVTPEVEPVVIPKFSFAALEKMLSTGPKAFITTEYMFGRKIYLQRSGGKNLDPLYVCWKVTHKKHHRYTEGPTPRIPFADYPARTDLNELSDFYRCERRREEGDKYPTYHKISKL